MTRWQLTIAAAIAGAALASPAMAGQRPAAASGSQAASARAGGPGPGGGGQAVARSAPSAPSSGVASRAPASSGAAARPAAIGSRFSPMSRPAPEHRVSYDQHHAVPRGGSSAGSSSAGRTAPRSSAPPRSTASEGRPRGGSLQGVPSGSRPRGSHEAIGTAVPRTTPIPGHGGNSYYPYYPYFYPGVGLGLGYYYSPLYAPWGYGFSPYGYPGYGYSYGYPGYGYPGLGGSGYYGGGSYYGGGGYSSSDSSLEQGALRLKVKPRDAKVYVDGYYVGTVDEFDGVFQRLNLNAGSHKLEVKADGFEPETADVMISPGETVTYQGDLRRIQ